MGDKMGNKLGEDGGIDYNNVKGYYYFNMIAITD